MTESVEFDLLNAPLDGRNLIEASAGTGKTYAISRIFLRLIVEKQCDIGKILAVTFTEAATEELRRRIREILIEAKLAFETGATSDPLLRALLIRREKEASLDIIKSALGNFDKAAIYTIHGFCQRFLQENAFECNQTFDARFITDQSELFQEIVDDFWRLHFFRGSPLFLGYVLEKNVSPATLLDPLRQFASHPGLSVIPSTKETDTLALEREFLSALQNVRSVWESEKEDIMRLISPARLDGRKYREETCVRLFIDFQQYIKGHSPGPLLFKNFEKLTACVIASAAKKGAAGTSHEFFDLCESLDRRAASLRIAFDDRLLFLESRFLSYASIELSKRKERRNELYFDDLLIRVFDALKTRASADPIQSGFQAALIDEFQDTDPLQFAIFNTLFPKGSVLFIIGDPKQAIYSFRGADIFTYITASKRVDRRYTLSVNYRSGAPLVNAINSLFRRHASAFVNDSIGYSPVSAHCSYANERQGEDEPSPFKLWFLSRDGQTSEGAPFTMAFAKRRITEAVTSEILTLLHQDNGCASTMHKRLRPSDIAVIVRKNKEASMVHDALVNSGVPAIIESAGNVFAEPEAVDCHRLLIALLDYTRRDLCACALSTCFFGLDAGNISTIRSEEGRWEQFSAEWYGYHELWQTQGFIRMIRTLMVRQKVRMRMLSRFGGTRSLTNLLHLIELLHSEASLRRLTARNLCSWLATKIAQSSSKVADEEMVRLESDENAVRVMTIHKSKGLEFPIVFCPFSWAGSQMPKTRKDSPLFFHEPDNHAPTLALSPETIETNKPIAELETLAENVRLLYVALTRAQSKCYCVWGMISSAETSALAHLLHGNAATTTVQALGESIRGMSDAALLDQLATLEVDSGNSIKVVPLKVEDHLPIIPEPSPPLGFHCAHMHVALPDPWRIASFSSLTRTRHALGEEIEDQRERIDGDIDDVDQDAVNDTGAYLHAFPRGVQTGLFFHDVLEHLDFTQTDSDQTTRLIESMLADYGFPSTWLQPVRAMLINLVAKELPGEKSRFSLCAVALSSSLKEVEFYFPLKRITPVDFNVLFANIGIHSGKSPHEGFSRLEFSPIHGFMKGFMDCIIEHDGRYYLIDWKSNYLGGTFEDYEMASIEKAMTKHNYTLQYHIYLAALNKYLSLRVPNYCYQGHFGGVIYIFLRGISADPVSSAGIFFNKPPEALIAQLGELLMDK